MKESNAVLSGSVVTLRGHEGLDDAAVREANLSPEPRQSASTKSTTEDEKRLLEMLRAAFNLKTIDVDDNFFELDGDSLLAAGLFARIEQEFGITLALDVLFQCPTVRLLAEMIRDSTGPVIARAVVTIQSPTVCQTAGKPPLFCLPGIGGNVLEFAEFAKALGPSQVIYGIPPLGLNDDQPPHATIEQMAAHAVRQIKELQRNGPYHIAGYSLGGVVAFEAALQLRSNGDDVELLALFDSLLWKPTTGLGMLHKCRVHWRNLRNTSGRGRLHYVTERLRLLRRRLARRDLRWSEQDIVLGLDLSAASRNVARVHWDAWRSYQPRSYDGTVTLFTAEQRPNVSPGTCPSDPTLGWSDWTQRTIRVHRVSGTHLEILRNAALMDLAARLNISPPRKVRIDRQSEDHPI